MILAAVTTSLSTLRTMLSRVLADMTEGPPPVAVANIISTIDEFTDRKGFDLKRIALLGWSEAQRNPKLRTTMRAFYLGFRDQLAETAGKWRASGQISAAADIDDVAKAVLATLLGFIVQAAVIGDVEPASIGAGLRAFSID